MKTFGEFVHSDKSIADPKAAKKGADLVSPKGSEGTGGLFPPGSQSTGKGELFPAKKKVQDRQFLKEAKKKVSAKKAKPAKARKPKK